MTCKAIGCDTDLREACSKTMGEPCPCYCHSGILDIVLPSPESRKPFDDLVSQTQAEIQRALGGTIDEDEDVHFLGRGSE